MTVKEMNETMEEIKSLKLLKEETEEAIRALEIKAIEFLREVDECQDVDKKGNPIRKFIGNNHKATYSIQSRESIDKEQVKKILSEEEYKKVSKVSTYPVLRIN